VRRRVEKQRVAFDARAVAEQDRAQFPARSFEPLDARLLEAYAIGVELLALFVRVSGSAVGAQHDVACPRRHRARHLEAALPASIDRDPATAHFPPVAVGTLEHAAAEQVVDARDARHDVEQAGGDEQLAGAHATAGSHRHGEAAGRAPGRGHRLRREPHARIGKRLASRDVEEAGGRNAVAR
jgi:hypothetical protein